MSIKNNIASRKILLYSTQLMYSGGIESHVVEFCDAMAAEGVQVDLFVPNCQINPDALTRLKASCTRTFLYKSNRNKWIWIWVWIKFLLFNSKGYHSLYTNGQGNSIKIISSILFVKKKWVHHHHTSGDKADQDTWSQSYVQTLLQADQVIACASKNASQMQSVLNRTIDTIPCFSKKIIRHTKPIDLNDIKIGYYGRLIPEKGIDLICKLSNDAELTGITFHIWGKGEKYTDSYFKQFTNLNFHGSFTNGKELEQILNYLDGYILLSEHAEGLPISLLESMAAGLPWLATNKGGIPDIFCNASSTHIIEGVKDYSATKQAILDFVTCIKNKQVSSEELIHQYDIKFSKEALVKKWQQALFKN